MRWLNEPGTFLLASCCASNYADIAYKSMPAAGPYPELLVAACGPYLGSVCSSGLLVLALIEKLLVEVCLPVYGHCQ